MGTETLTIMIIAVWVYYLKVKLNNPHEGTETRLFARIDLLRIRRLVKLNNPHKATETAKIFGEIRYSIHTR